MTVRRLHQKQFKLDQLQKRLSTLQAQVRAEDRKVNLTRWQIIGQYVEENWLDSQQQFVGGLDLMVLKKELLQGLGETIKDNWKRELLGLELNLDERGKQTHKLIILGRILEKWVEWGRVNKQDFIEGLGQYLTRNVDRELFGFPLLGEASTSHYDDDILDSSELSSQKVRQKLVLMGRLLTKWVEQGKVSQAEYQSGLDGFIKVDSDRLLFGLTPLPKARKDKPQQTDNTATVPKKQEITTPVLPQGQATTSTEREKKVSPTQTPPARKLRSTKVSEDQFNNW